MKKALSTLLLFSAITITAQNIHRTNWDYVADIKPATWTKKVENTTTTHVNGNKTATTVGGAVVGHMLFGRRHGILGMVGGGLIGHAVGRPDYNQTTTTISYIKVDGYIITTGKGIVFKTLDYYKIFTCLDLNKINKE